MNAPIATPQPGALALSIQLLFAVYPPDCN
jgi:hypothetical protein